QRAGREHCSARGGASKDPALAKAIARIAAQALRERELRFRVEEDPARANVIAQLRYRRTDDGVTLQLDLGPRGGRISHLPEAHASSVAGAFDLVLGPLSETLGAGQKRRGLDD